MADKPAYSLPVSSFRSDQDDFDAWIELFEDAVKVAHPSADAAAIQALNLKWLPLKLDDDARTIYGSKTETTWPEVKKELKKLLVNPEDRYSWHARRNTIVWDGQESLHALATRVKRAVNKFDADNSEEGKKREYFVRFRLALPAEYKKAIDMNCGDVATLCTIEEAKKIALKLQMANSEAIASAGGAKADPVPKTVAFHGAAMSDDRLKSLEMAMEGITVRLDKMESKSDKKESKDKEEDRTRGYSSSRERYESRYNRPDRRDDSRNRDRGRDNSRDQDRNRERGRDRDNRDRRSSRDSRDRQSDRPRDNYRSFSSERRFGSDRDRRDSYDRRRDSRDYDSRNRRPSYERQNNYSRPFNDRNDSRDRRSSRDGWDSRRADSSDRRSQDNGFNRIPWGNRSQNNGFDQNSSDSRSRDNGYNRNRFGSRDRNNQDYGNQRNDRQPSASRDSYRAGDFDIEYICAALAEKKLRDENAVN